MYSVFVLNRCWKPDFLQMTMFVNVCSTCSVVQLKTRYETRITRNDVNGVILFHLSYLITLKGYLCSQWTPLVQIKYFKFDLPNNRLFLLHRRWKRDTLQITIFVYVSSAWSIVELKTRFEIWITRNDVNGISLFHLSYLITLVAYMCSKWAPNFQFKYFMFDWSICRLFVLKRGWKRDSLQINIFVYISSSWSIFELKMRFEMWITRNYVKCVSVFHLLI
jgi:hypothetical protein